MESLSRTARQLLMDMPNAPMPGEGGMNASGSGGMGMGMQMTFYWGKDLTLLFSGWMTTKPAHYVLTLLVVFIFAILHQFLSHLHKLQSAKASDGKDDAAGAKWLKLVLQVVLYAAYTSTSYLLMLMVMSYNVGVFIAIVVGLSSGFLMFQKRSSSKDAVPAQGI